MTRMPATHAAGVLFIRLLDCVRFYAVSRSWRYSLCAHLANALPLRAARAAVPGIVVGMGSEPLTVQYRALLERSARYPVADPAAIPAEIDRQYRPEFELWPLLTIRNLCHRAVRCAIHGRILPAPIILL